MRPLHSQFHYQKCTYWQLQGTILWITHFTIIVCMHLGSCHHQATVWMTVYQKISVSYASIDQAGAMAQGLGQGCLLDKLDLKEAYRAVPVHSFDQRLLVVQWEGATYMDKALPLAFAQYWSCFPHSQMLWCGSFINGVSVQPYTTWMTSCCWVPQDPQSVLSPCRQPWPSDELGFHVAPEKTEGPSTVLTFSGDRGGKVSPGTVPPWRQARTAHGYNPAVVKPSGKLLTLGLGKKAWPSVPTQAAQPSCSRGAPGHGFSPQLVWCRSLGLGARPLGSPQPSSLRWPGMVVHFYSHMEWKKHYATNQPLFRYPIWCFGDLGLWGSLRWPVVPTAMALFMGKGVNCPKIIHTHCDGGNPLGSSAACVILQ